MKPRAGRSALLGLVLLMAAGCASTGELHVPATAAGPDAWHTAAAGVVVGSSQDIARWWEQFGDATLNDIIIRALRGSTDIRAAQARLVQARAERNIARADLLPTVNVSASASGQRASGGAFAAGFDASWEPDVFGGTRRGVEAAQADLQASAEDVYATQVSLVAEVARNYTELRTLQRRLDLAQRNATSQAETAELTGFRAQAGLVSSVDVEQARANLEQTRAAISSIEVAIAQTIHRIGTLAGLEPAALDPELSPPAAIPVVPAQIDVGIPADALRQRPDVRAAEQRITAESARLAKAETRRYPTFSLSGTLGTEVLAGALTGGTSLVATAAATVAKTIFDRGRIGQQIAAQGAVQEQAVISYQATVLTALEEVENALVSFEKNRQRLLSLTAATEAASNAAVLAQSQYSAGLADFQRVLDTQRTVLTVQDSAVTTEGDRVMALVQLYKALGGGWSATP
jgi:NodT family efflux transporter outer membrane factor (OMF) lipoprotein